MRSYANGNETVPTVVVDGIGLVNPSPSELLASARRARPAPAPRRLTTDRGPGGDYAGRSTAWYPRRMSDPRLDGTEIADSVIDLIGNTPLVRMKRVSEDQGIECVLAMKAETTNPGGSSKDRPALEMILAAERDGLLRPGGTIVEPTSGNTGVGLAIVAAQRGYRCVFVMTDKVAPEKVSLLKAYGAEVVVCPVAVEPDDPQSYYSVAERLTNELDAFRPNQYDNPHNPESHELTTGPELWRQTDGRITHFVAGAGTCGSITGVGPLPQVDEPGDQDHRRRPGGLGLLRRIRPPVPRRRASVRTSSPPPGSPSCSTTSSPSATRRAS